ncbi:MAG: hypothetical protein JO119_17410, partial [Acidobacteria bacterium]|nr:hypothetical protein [Acidobacteriota bacterium]
PNWRENPQRVRELDWHFQLEGIGKAQANAAHLAAAAGAGASDSSAADESELTDDAEEELDRPPADAKEDPYEGLEDGPVDEDDVDDGPVNKDDV